HNLFFQSIYSFFFFQNFACFSYVTYLLTLFLPLLAIKHLQPLVIPKLTTNKIKEITTSFECLHGIPCILGAIDGSHVPIIAPK
ncbi:unnamed protein product, partial [Sphagnum balticum]